MQSVTEGVATNKLYYALPDLGKFVIGGDQMLVYSPLTQEAQLVEAQLQVVFSDCLKPATLDEHTANLMRKYAVPQHQESEVRQRLQLCIKHGWLVSDQHVVTPLMQLPTRNEIVQPITWLGVPTKDRPESLLSCIESFAKCCAKFDKTQTVKFLVSDQSENKENIEQNLSILRALKQTYSIEIHYIGLEEHRELSRKIAELGGFEQSTVDFALLNDENLPSGVGCNRNALLLSTVGEMLMMCDDDAVCRLAPIIGQQSGLQVTSRADATEFWFYSEQELEEAQSKLEILNLFAVHEQLLGKTVRQCMEEADGPIVAVKAGGSLLRKEQNVDIPRVLCTMPGMIGESGMSGLPTPFLRAEDETRARLVQSEAVYREAMTKHLIARSVRRNTITEGGFCMGLNLGLDNRDFLPPFMPVMRNEDGSFGALLVSLCKANMGFLPWTVHHKAFGHRFYPPEEMTLNATQIRAGGILAVLFGAYKPGLHHRNARKNLIKCGKLAAESALLNPPDFAELISSVMWNFRAKSSVHTEELLKLHQNQPPCWAQDMRSVLEATRSSMMRDTFAVPDDLGLFFNPQDALAVLQRIVMRFSLLLQIWPGIIDVAKTLRRNEVQIAKRI